MSKHFWVIALELVLVAVLGLLGNLAASQLNINQAYVWTGLVILMPVLIATTWFRVGVETGRATLNWKVEIPERVTFSFSTASIFNGVRVFLGLVLNGTLFGLVTAFASVFAVRVFELRWSQELYFTFIGGLGPPAAFSWEIVGVFTIGFAGVFVLKRLTPILGIAFVITASLVFSITHLTLLPYQPVFATLAGNLISALLILVIGLITLPLWRFIWRQVVGFWAELFRK